MRLAVIGVTGHVGYALQTLQQRSSLTLVSAAPGGPEEDLAAFITHAKTLGFSPVIYGDWREMLERERIDVAVVAPWYFRCADISMECLRRGIHVYSEKPLATTLTALDALTDTWSSSGCALDGMFGLRYSGWFLAIRQAVEEGLIGQVRQLHGQKSYRLGTRGALYRSQALYGGILPWVGIHAIDWVMQLGGGYRHVYGLHSRRENRDHGELEVSSAALLELENGIIATVTADFLRPEGSARHDDDRLRVTGTRGMIEAADGRVWLENESPRRELSLPKAPAPMEDFLDSIGTPRSAALTRMALEATRAALEARDRANAQEQA